MWTHCKLVHGKPRHKQPQRSVERCNRDVEAKLACWMKDNHSEKWSKGLRFVQLAKNTCFHSGIGRSPYVAVFGSEPKLGLTSLHIPKEVMEQMESEEDLEKIFYSKVDNSDIGTRMADGDLHMEDAAVLSTADRNVNALPETIDRSIDMGNNGENPDNQYFQLENLTHATTICSELQETNGEKSLDNQMDANINNFPASYEANINVCISCSMPTSGAHSCMTCYNSCHAIALCSYSHNEEEGFGCQVICRSVSYSEN